MGYGNGELNAKDVEQEMHVTGMTGFRKPCFFA